MSMIALSPPTTEKLQSKLVVLSHRDDFTKPMNAYLDILPRFVANAPEISIILFKKTVYITLTLKFYRLIRACLKIVILTE